MMIRTGRMIAAGIVLAAAAASGPTRGTAAADPELAPGSPQEAPRNILFTYEAAYGPLPKDRRTYDVWVPLPWVDQNQKISELVIRAPYQGETSVEPEYGNRIFHVRSGPRGGAPIQVSFRFRVDRAVVRFPDLTRKPSSPVPPPSNLARYLKSDRLVPVDDETKALAAQITKGRASAADKARAIYDHVVDTIRHDKSGQGWGRGDLRFILTTRKGNSADIAAAFTGLARATGIPARSVMGFKIPTEGKEGFLREYQAWAEFWLDDLGWIPVDPAEAVRRPESRDAYFGSVDRDRIQFSVGRDVVLAPPQNGDPINFLLYPYAEGDGQPLGGAAYRFQWQEPPPTEPGAEAKPAGAPAATDPNASGGAGGQAAGPGSGATSPPPQRNRLAGCPRGSP